MFHNARLYSTRFLKSISTSCSRCENARLRVLRSGSSLSREEFYGDWWQSRGFAVKLRDNKNEVGSQPTLLFTLLHSIWPSSKLCSRSCSSRRCTNMSIYGKLSPKKFKDVERANNSWKEIASTIQSVGVTASDDACKKKWKYLRDSYARLKRECSSKSGDGAQSTSRNVHWKFYWCLSFLDDATSATQQTTVNSTGGSQDFEDEDSNETTVGETPPAPKRRKLANVSSPGAAEQEVLACLRQWSEKNKTVDDLHNFGQYVSSSLRQFDKVLENFILCITRFFHDFSYCWLSHTKSKWQSCKWVASRQ